MRLFQEFDKFPSIFIIIFTDIFVAKNTYNTSRVNIENRLIADLSQFFITCHGKTERIILQPPSTKNNIFKAVKANDTIYECDV